MLLKKVSYLPVFEAQLAALAGLFW